MPQPESAYLPERLLFQWHLTDRCNLSCSHCYQENSLSADLSWDDLMNILGQFMEFTELCRSSYKGKGFRSHITVTGGEPFLHSDLIPLLELLAAARKQFSFAILSNGTMLDRDTVRRLKLLEPSFVQVSIDGSQETHDRIRGNGAYDKAVHGARLLARAGIPLYLSFTANVTNYREFPSVVRLGRSLGAARVWSDRMVPCGGAAIYGGANMTPAETREYVGIMAKERRRRWFRRSPVLLHRALQFAATGARPYRCTAGDTLLTILPNGDLCPCRRMPIVAGNILKEPLAALYRSSPLLLGLRDRARISSGCEHCFYARTCGGGARCISWAVHGDPFRADPGCWMKKVEIDENFTKEAL